VLAAALAGQHLVAVPQQSKPQPSNPLASHMSKRTTNRYVGSKVPAVTPWFWATKIVMTATGEAISDAMNQQLGPASAVPIMVGWPDANACVFTTASCRRKTQPDNSRFKPSTDTSKDWPGETARRGRRAV
jgi:hypothetical protein